MGVPTMKLFNKQRGWNPTVPHHPLPTSSSDMKLFPYRRQILKSLHLVLEVCLHAELVCCIIQLHLCAQELKLYTSEVGSLTLLTSLLYHVATCLGFPSYCDLYHTHYPCLIPSSMAHTSDDGRGEEKMECDEEEGEGGGEDTSPLNLMSHLHLMLAGGREQVSALVSYFMWWCQVGSARTGPISIADWCVQQNSADNSGAMS